MKKASGLKPLIGLYWINPGINAGVTRKSAGNWALALNFRNK